MPSIAVIGAGFSGTLLALHLMRLAPAGTSVALVERNSQFGRGQAYATGNASHLLNVPAGRMSAFHDRPRDFLDWLCRQHDMDCGTAPPDTATFVPRARFGAYVRHLLNEEIKRDDRPVSLELVRGDVLAIAPSEHGMRLRLDRERTLDAGIVVLAIGNMPPEAPKVATPEFYDGPLYRPDPWAPDLFEEFDPDAPVLLIGTGLTMVDSVVSLLDRGHRGPITALSRRGLLPRRHEPAAARPPGPPRPFPTKLGKLLRSVRAHARVSVEEGGSWQPAVDEIRPFAVDVWQGLSVEDRRRFMRHLRPWWDVHRHRMAPEVATRIDAARANGQLIIKAGRLEAFEPAGDGQVEAVYRPRFTQGRERLLAARVVNCSGPGADFERIGDPLVRGMLEDGLVRPDPLGLGLDVTGSCALLDREGAISRRLFAIGPVTKAAFWEMTAVPDIRRQCEFLAMHLAGLARPVAVAA